MVDPHCEITMTAGATQIIFTALSSVGHPADEVIVLTPAHNGYEPKIILAGSRVFHIPLKEGRFRPDFPAVAAALSARTRAIIINPHNPTSTICSDDDMQPLAALLQAPVCS